MPTTQHNKTCGCRADSEIGFVQKACEYVRDKLPHAADIGEAERIQNLSFVSYDGIDFPFGDAT
ncbi:MAG: hypothetical protein IKN55_00570 [Oscillospiraceae bacterium]|nr:hypothetical protein [Oscillospiraceae bacterium]